MDLEKIELIKEVWKERKHRKYKPRSIVLKLGTNCNLRCDYCYVEHRNQDDSLDIELVQADGVSVGKFIRNEMEDINTHIVYISSRQAYAMQLFKIQPLDFLVKPVSDGQIKEVLIRSIRQKQSLKSCFEYQKGSVIFRIPTKDIAYFMSMDKKIRVITRDGEDEFYGKLKSIMERLPADFMMIHQSYIVNQLYVSEYSYDCVKMSDGTILGISKPYRKEVRGKIKQYGRAEIYGEL